MSCMNGYMLSAPVAACENRAKRLGGDKYRYQVREVSNKQQYPSHVRIAGLVTPGHILKLGRYHASFDT